jgi:hypothetical protein
MDQQVSPAVVVIVLILIVAILVGLYFLVVERGPQTSEEAGMDMAPMEAGEMPPDQGPAEDVDADGGGDAEADQPDTATEQTDENSEGETAQGGSDAEDTASDETGDDAGV